MKLQGNVHIYGNNVDTDVIIPARYLNTRDPQELAAHCLEDLDPAFITKVKKGDFIVAGANFGCGSSREHAPIALKAAGISCVIAESFARIFYRNSINIGLPIIECPAVVEDAEERDVLIIDLEKGEITNLNKKKTYSTQPFPPFIQSIVSAGGLMGAVEQELL